VLRGTGELALGSHYLVLSQHLPVFDFDACSQFGFDLFFFGHWGFEGLVGLHIHDLNVVAHESKHLACFLLDHGDFNACVDRTDYVLLGPRCNTDGYDSGFRGPVFAWLGFFVFDDFARFPIHNYVVADL
jgi:hypothetical protein